MLVVNINFNKAHFQNSSDTEGRLFQKRFKTIAVTFVPFLTINSFVALRSAHSTSCNI